MMTEPWTTDRRIRILIATTAVLIGVIANMLVDMIAVGEFSQWTGYRKWKPYGIFAVYYPTLINVIRWLVPLLGLGTVVLACRREIRGQFFVGSLCLFAVVATACTAIGVFMVYGLYSVTHHVLGG